MGINLSRIQKILLSLLVLFFAVFQLRTVFFPPTSLIIDGYGKFDTEYEGGSIIVSVRESASSSQEVLEKGERKIGQLMEQARVFANGPVEVRQTSYTVRPVGTNFEYNNSFSTTLTDISNMKKLVQIFYESGAAEVSGLVLDIKNENFVNSKVFSIAQNDASKKAKEYAKASKKRIGRVLTISEDKLNIGGNLVDFSDKQENKKPLVEVSKHVQAIYELW